MSPSFKTIAAVADVLKNKADFGLRLTAAYKAGDKDALAALMAECDVIIEKLGTLKKCHRASYHLYNRPFGWELHDGRSGRLIGRFETAKDRIGAYLAGEIASIEELDAPRLPLFGKEGEIGATFKWQGASVFASPNILT